MPIIQTSTRKQDNGSGIEKPRADQFFAAGSGFDLSMRAICRALLQTQCDAEAYLKVNRDFLDEMQGIVRKEQDIAMEILDRLLRKASDEKWPANVGAAFTPTEASELFERATNSVRELGHAWVNAQLKMIEAMRNHVRAKRPGKVTQRTVSEAA